jgi:hypothetical protein
MMASIPIPDNLTTVLAHLANRLESLEARLDRIKALAGLTIASVGPSTDSKEATKVPPFTLKTTKGKCQANTPNAPSKAKPAKKECSTRKAATLPNPIPLHLAQTFPMEGKTDHHLIMAVIPDSMAQQVIGQGRKGLKQVHDISSARVNAYTLASGLHNERHVSI